MNTESVEGKFLKLADLRKLVPLSVSHIYALVGEGKFPKPVKLSPGTSRWLRPEVEAWLAERIQERDKAA